MPQDIKHALLVGRLVMSKSRHGDGNWLKLEIPKAIAKGFYSALNEPGLELPPGNTHITVMTADEVAKVGPKAITECGKFYPFRLEGLKHVRPKGWDEMSRVYFITVKSPELKKLRASYGLSPLVHDTHEFHITVAVRRKGILAPNNSITKQAFVGRELLMPAAAGLAGTALGALADRKRKSKGNWLQRHIGALLGGIGGVAAGSIPKLAPSVMRGLKDPNANDSTSLDTIRPVDDSQLVDKQPAVGEIDTSPAAEALNVARPAAEELLRSSVEPSAVAGTMGFSGAVGALMPKLMGAVDRSLPSRLAAGAKSMKTTPAILAGQAGAAGGFMAADKLQENLGIQPGANRIVQDVNASAAGGLAGSTLANRATNRVIDYAKPLAQKWFPKAMDAYSKFTPGQVMKPLTSLGTKGLARLNAASALASELVGPMAAGLGAFTGAQPGHGFEEARKACSDAAPDTLTGGLAGSIANKIYK